MIDTNSPLARAVLKVFLVIGVLYAMFHAKVWILPILVAGLLAMLVNPIDNKLLEKGWPKWASITVCMLLIVTVFGALFAAVGHQAASFSDNWPEIKSNFTEQMQAIRSQFGLQGVLPQLSTSGDEESGALSKLPVNNDTVIGFVQATLGILGDFFLMLIYVVLMLSEKTRLRQFVLRRMPNDDRGLTHRTLNESLDVAQKYLKGRLILIAVLSVLYGIGFSFGGVSYALLLAVLAAVTSIIPWIGNIFGAAIALAVSFANGDGSTALLTIGITMTVAQMLESYVLTPLIVGDEVNLNPLTVILGVLGLTYVWGPVGALIGIPFLGIMRVVFSHVNGMRDYAFLLGQEKP